MSKAKPLQLRRAAIQVTGTTCATKANLSHEAALALQWAATWASQRLHGRRVPTSAVIRRALVAYVESIEAMGDDSVAQRIEAVRLASAGAVYTDPASQDLAGCLRLLSEVKRGAAMPSFRGLVRATVEPSLADSGATSAAPQVITGDPRPRPWDRQAQPGPQFQGAGEPRP